jgi:hypothetical protein
MTKSGLAEPETVHDVIMMLSRVRRWHDDGVSDDNFDMLMTSVAQWRAVRDELDVLNVGSGYEPPWHDALDVLDVDHDVTVVTASVDSSADPDADPDKHGDSVKANPS